MAEYEGSGNAHEHSCIKCRPYELPESRLTEGHLSPRFGDHLLYERESMQITLDGAEVNPNHVAELMCGPAGWLVVYCDPVNGGSKYTCACSQEICSRMLKGNVTFRGLRHADIP